MPAVRVDDIDLYYECDGTGPTIVFAHGGASTHLHWWQQVAAFRTTHRCITYDARGFGLSGRVPSDRGTRVHHLDLLGLLDALDVERAVLVGQSMGGYAVSGMALHHPERVAGLVMADTPFGFQTAALGEWAEQMIEKLNAGFDVIPACVSTTFAARRPDLALLTDYMARLNPTRTGPRGLDAYDEMRTRPPGDYADFAVPTLFIVGTEDALTFPWLIEATAQAIPGAHVQTIAGAGHSPYFEQAEAFNAVLAQWLHGAPNW
jgi:pimeloyl-ACP methyl ester carboxylesterase